MGRRSSRHAKNAARIEQNNKSVKNDAGKSAFFNESRKKAETQRLLEKYGLGRQDIL